MPESRRLPGPRSLTALRPLPRRRPARAWWTDAAVAAGALALGSLLLVASMTEDPDIRGAMAEQIALGLGAAAALLLYRRSHPVPLALVLIPVGLSAPAAAGATCAALCSAAANRRPRTAFAVAGLHALLVLVLFRLVTDSWRDYWTGAGTFLFLDALAVALGLLLRSQRMLVRSLRERARQADEEHRLRVEEARHHERERLAREMHDVLAHRISLLAVHAGALEFGAGADSRQARAAGIIRECAHEALEDLRDVIRMLRTEDAPGDADRPQPTLADLPVLVEESRRTGAAVDFDAGPADPAAVPHRVGRHAYRIVQEGLTNARKHAPGSAVRVTVTMPEPTLLTVEVANSVPRQGASGAAPGPVAALPGAGAGLIGLGERVALVGGRLEHGPEQGEFRLRAWLPWTP